MDRSFWRPVAFLLALGALPSASLAQDCQIKTPMKAMTIGRLAFLQAKNPTYAVDGEERINEIVNCDFKWRAESGNFSLAQNLAGTFKNLVISGQSNLPDGTRNRFMLPRGSVSFALTLSAPISVQLLGGKVVIPKDTTLQVTNDTTIQVVGAKVSGSLSFGVEGMTWKKAVVKPPFGFPQMTLSTSSTGVVRFRTDARDGQTRIADGTFVTGDSLSATNLSNNSDGQKAKARRLSATLLTFHVTEKRVELSVKGVAADGAVVIKRGPALPVPVFADGKWTAAELRTAMDATTVAGGFERFDIEKLRYTPTPPGPDGSHYTSDEVALASGLGIRTLSNDQADAIAEGLESLQSTPYFNFFASLAPSDLLDATRTMLQKLSVFGTLKSIALENQLIVAETDLASGTEPMERAVLRISPSIVDRVLKLRTSMSFVEPVASVLNHTNSDSLLTSMANHTSAAAEPFSAGTEVEIDVPIDLPEVGPINVATEGDIDGHGKYQLSSTPVTLPLHLASSTVLVDHNGAHILANLAEP